MDKKIEQSSSVDKKVIIFEFFEGKKRVGILSWNTDAQTPPFKMLGAFIDAKGR